MNFALNTLAMSNKPFRINDRIKSIGFAVQGIIIFFKTQHNSWIQAIAAIVVIIFGFIFNLNHSEWCLIVGTIALVFITEMLNTAIEFLSDMVSSEIHPKIKKINPKIPNSSHLRSNETRETFGFCCKN